MEADSQPERLYAGEFRHSIDDKNRITIPSRWRHGRPEEFILLPEATHQFLIVMSPKEFAKMSLSAAFAFSSSACRRRPTRPAGIARRALPKSRIERRGRPGRRPGSL